MAEGLRLWPFGRSQARADAERLAAAVTQVSRQPGFYGPGRVADTLEGRLELAMLHACLALIRLKRDVALEPLGQNFADVLFKQFDAGLREADVADTKVPKRMHQIAGDFYGRLNVYAAALAAGDRAALADALARNVLGKTGAPFAETLAAYVTETAAKQADAAPESLFRLDGWSLAPA